MSCSGAGRRERFGWSYPARSTSLAPPRTTDGQAHGTEPIHHAPAEPTETHRDLLGLTDHRCDEGSPLDFDGVSAVEDAELEHGLRDALDPRLVHWADRVTGQRNGRGYLGRQVVVLRHGGLDNVRVGVGQRLPLLDGPHESGRRLRVPL